MSLKDRILRREMDDPFDPGERVQPAAVARIAQIGLDRRDPALRLPEHRRIEGAAINGDDRLPVVPGQKMGDQLASEIASGTRDKDARWRAEDGHDGTPRRSGREGNARGRRHGDRLAGWRERAAFGVDGEDGNRAAVLVRGKEIAPGRVDRDVAWRAAAARHGAEKAQAVALTRNRRDDVVAAGRCVQEASVRMQGDTGGRVGLGMRPPSRGALAISTSAPGSIRYAVTLHASSLTTKARSPVGSIRT